MALLLYHPESDSYVVGEHADLEADGLLVDVSGEDDHELAAVIAGVDISEVDGESYSMPEKLLAAAHGVTPEAITSNGGLAGAIAASMAKWARKPADLYPTPADCTYSLIPHIEDILPAGSRILEPACADGQMSKALEEFGYLVDSYDLRPEVAYGTGGVDFLDRDNGVFEDEWDAVITNPPFKAADLFIRRALELAPVVVMLLKAQYWNTANRKGLFRQTKPFRELNLTWRPAFLEAERGKSPLMDCMWVVWRRGHDGLPTVDMIDRLMTCPLPADSFGGL